MKNNSALSLQDVSFSYNGRESVLTDLSALFLPGKFYGLLGPNGSGKTTLLDLLAGIKKPSCGQVFIGDSLLDSYGKRELARKITLVPQEFSVDFDYSVEELIMMGRHPYIARFAKPGPADWQAVEQAIAAVDIDRLRHTIATTLSGGQKQRVVVARALAQQCPIMLFDEATANLDIRHTIRICTIAERAVAGGATVIAAIHDLNLAAAFCDEILFLKRGRILCHGPTETTMTAENIASIYAVKSTISGNEPIRIHFHYKDDDDSTTL